MANENKLHCAVCGTSIECPTCAERRSMAQLSLSEQIEDVRQRRYQAINEQNTDDAARLLTIEHALRAQLARQATGGAE